MIIGRTLTAMALALAVLPVAASARPAHPARPAARAVVPHVAGLAEFVDGVVAQQIATREVAGAIVTVVYQGHVLFTRGYGRSDVARGVPVDAQRALFHPGSVSKLFTWTALMQQVEAGKVDLDADVNSYIDFKIPPFEGKPVRVRDLMSHSPGFSDVGGLIYESFDKTQPYQQWLKTRIPARLWPAGTEIAYSNYGAALAGYIVERVSGEPFADYVDRHIFGPLGMHSSTFREPLTGTMRANMATGYKVVDGRFVAKPGEYLSSVMPAGSVSATAPDMARFMLAMLNNGQLGGHVILRPATVKLLESDSFGNAPDLQPMAHGYLVYRQAGPRLVGHAGNTVDFHSDLIISPETGFGFFVSTSGGQGSYLARTELSQAIVGRVFPQTPAPRWTGASGVTEAGHYRANRRDYSRPADPRHDMVVTATGPNSITTEVEGVKTAWDQIGPHLYEQVTGARAGGPFNRLQFYGTPQDPRLSLGSEPYETYHYVKPE
ncbi:MAG TPA: serine hydrolase domain-containing protein [Sphingomonas sp.]|nr:serine hydrolase domain-containing protein [Sphingomonas sp.]